MVNTQADLWVTAWELVSAGKILPGYAPGDWFEARSDNKHPGILVYESQEKPNCPGVVLQVAKVEDVRWESDNRIRVGRLLLKP